MFVCLRGSAEFPVVGTCNCGSGIVGWEGYSLPYRGCRRYEAAGCKDAGKLVMGVANWRVGGGGGTSHSQSRCQNKRDNTTAYSQAHSSHVLSSACQKALDGQSCRLSNRNRSILDAAFTTPPILPSFPPETPIAAVPPPPTDAELDAAWGQGASTPRLPSTR